MPFNLSDAQVPSGFSTKDFLLRPIRASDARLDFEAVMESRDFLRLWEQTGWPEDNFTVEENRADLAKMVQRHRDREAFAYTVMDPGETQCLGCVYLFPVDAEIFSRSNIVPYNNTHWADYSAAVFFWVRTSRLTVALDQTLLKALGDWLRETWRFSNCLFVTSQAQHQQVEMFETSGLVRMFRIDDPKASGPFLAYRELAPMR